MARKSAGAVRVSIAEAKNRLPSLVHEVERGRPVELTRRGEPVAAIVSIHQRRLDVAARRGGFWEAAQRWRRVTDLAKLDLGPDYFEALRDRSPGRKPPF